MKFNGFCRNVKGSRNLLCRFAFRDQLENFALSRGKWGASCFQFAGGFEYELVISAA
jgi:hypothetical protein